MALLGRGALALALLLAVYAVVTAILAGRRRDLRYVESARHALYAVLAAVLVADFVFLLAIVRHDFSFVTVADTTSRDLPLGYLLSSFWGSQAGLADAVADDPVRGHGRRHPHQPALATAS